MWILEKRLKSTMPQFNHDGTVLGQMRCHNPYLWPPAQFLAGALAKRMAGGPTLDLVVLAPAAIEALTRSHKVLRDSRTDLARVGSASREAGTSKPDVSAVDAFSREIVPAPRGVTLVGLLPQEVQNHAIYSAVIGAAIKHADAARAVAVLPVLRRRRCSRRRDWTQTKRGCS